jgi:NAD(P)-dependent dehydrogenase (short-subunit alcohol dehydrogenase family)
MSLLDGHVAVVTGASSGVGRAVAVALSREGTHVCGVGRNSAALVEMISATHEFAQAASFQIDLTLENDVLPLLRHLESTGRLDILIHCAGIICPNPMERARIEDFDSQYATNVRAPYVLTQRLLPLLAAPGGQIVFVNSSVGLAAKQPHLGQYSATKHALRAVADSLREELNPKGIRVLSVFLGRTATPMQEAIFCDEGKTYQPELLLQPEDVASFIVHSLKLPPTAEVTDISIRPMRKTY